MTHLRKQTFLQRLQALAGNLYLWKGLAMIFVITGVLYVLFNYLLMPAYTRHGISVAVPDVLDYSPQEAAGVIESFGLRTEQVLLRKPNLPRNVVIDQNPPPNTRVKPVRRIYLTVNSGDTTTVLVPKVEGFSVREARNRIMIQGLAVQDVFPDSIPSAHANTITKQSPIAGERVPPGAHITLWYSTGLGDRQVLVPDVMGMAAQQAQGFLLNMRLRSVIIGDPTIEKIIRSQSPLPGTSVREGFEIRLRLTDQ